MNKLNTLFNGPEISVGLGIQLMRKCIDMYMLGLRESKKDVCVKP